MLVRVLGDVTLVATDGRTVDLPGKRQPALLAALAARNGSMVSTDRLIDLLWQEDPPENPAAALHSAVFKLRANLTAASGREVLATREGGYQLQLAPGELDADTFTEMVARAGEADPPTAARALTEALALWRGPAYGAFADSDIAHLEALALEELRLTTVERCAEALVATDRSREAIALLRPFVAEHPLREAARVALMRALHEVGRTAEALEEYQQHRRHLADDLGLEPSPLMQSLQVELLRGATASAPTVPAARVGLPGLQVRYLRTGGGRILAYGSVGDGAKLVVILGWVSSLDVIASGRDPRSSLLERLTSHLAITLFDRAGTGLSPGPVDDYGLEASVEELTEVVREIGPPVALMAMSAGGPIALTLAHRRPEWVDSLVLFGTFASAPRTFADERLRTMVVEIAQAHWGIGSKMLADMYRPGLSDEAAWHLAKVFRDSADPEVAASYLESLFEQDVSHLLPEIHVPALVLHYRSDRLIWFRGGQELASGLPHATFLPLDGQVHLPDARDLDTIEEAIVSHVRRNGP